MKPLYLIDASIYVFRAFYSIPDNFFDKNGNLVNGVYGYTNFLLDFLQVKPEFVSVAFDESLNTCYRNDIFPVYKANREQPTENIKYQFEKCQEITRLLGLHNLCLKFYEADDIIGTLAAELAADSTMIIVTRDKDLGQLLKPGDQMWDFAADQFTDPGRVFDKFGVRCDQLADFLALAGDAVDNIPGAPGVGAKTAARLLDYFGTLDNLLANLDQVPDTKVRGANKLQLTLSDHADMIRIYRQITGIKCDVPMDVTLEDVRLTPVRADEMTAFCEQLNFGERLHKRLLAYTA